MPMVEEHPEYPNATLVEVSFEIRFSPVLKIVNEIYLFQEAIKEHFFLRPNHIQQNPNVPAQTISPSWEFHGKDEETILKVSLDRFIINSKKYRSYIRFRPIIEDCLSKFDSTFNINPILRVGLRYIDNFEISSIQEIPKYYKLYINQDMSPMEDTLMFAIETRMKKEDNILTIRSGTIETIPDTKWLYIYDTDAYRLGNFNNSELISICDSLRKTIWDEFKIHITEKMEEYLKGNGD